jgi:hypothetical protein
VYNLAKKKMLGDFIKLLKVEVLGAAIMTDNLRLGKGNNI